MSSYVERNRGFITSSKIRAIIEDPESFKYFYVDEVEPDRDEGHFRLGRAYDDLMSYGEEYVRNKYRFGQADKSEGEMLYADEARAIEKMIIEAKRQPLLRYGDKSYKPQVQIKASISVPFGSSFLDVPVKATLDRVNMETHHIIDDKTTSDLKYLCSANIYRCPIHKYNYGLQAAFYCMLYKVKYMKDVPGMPKFSWGFMGKPANKDSPAKGVLIDVPIECLSGYFDKNGSYGEITKALSDYLHYMQNGFPSKRDISVKDKGMAHLDSKIYGKTEGSIQLEAYRYSEYLDYSF